MENEKHIHFTGSTDCICYATVGIIDPETSALHIIVGRYLPHISLPCYQVHQNIQKSLISMSAFFFLHV